MSRYEFTAQYELSDEDKDRIEEYYGDVSELIQTAVNMAILGAKEHNRGFDIWFRPWEPVTASERHGPRKPGKVYIAEPYVRQP